MVIEEEEHYAYCSFMKISGTTQSADVKWYANTFASSYNVPYRSEISELGEVCEFNNPIVSDELVRRAQRTGWRITFPSGDSTRWKPGISRSRPGGFNSL